MMVKYSPLLLVSFLCLFGNQNGYAQNAVQSGTQPLPPFSQPVYVVIPTTGPMATHVKTRRAGRKGNEFLDLINVILPEGFVLQKLVSSKDIGNVGLRIHDELLVAMAVLPNLNSGQVKWFPIKPDTVASARQVAWETVANDCYTRLFNYELLGGPQIDWSQRRLDLRPIIKIGNQYFTTDRPVLTEYFVLRSYPTWYPTSGDNATINCSARLFTPRDYERELNLALSSVPPGQPAPRLRGELGTKLLLQKIEGDTYTFWSLTPKIYDGGVANFGVGDLRYKQNVGLISGLYTTYFGLDDVSPDNKFFDLIGIETLTIGARR